MKLAVPTVIAQLVNMLYNIIDRVYIGHIPGEGSMALTGVGVCMPLILIIAAFAALVGSGGSPRASIYMGKGEHDTAEKILTGCLSHHTCDGFSLGSDKCIHTKGNLYKNRTNRVNIHICRRIRNRIFTGTKHE